MNLSKINFVNDLGQLDGSESSSDVTHSFAETDAAVRYPSYVSFDRFIDVERLRSLDSVLRGHIERRIQNDSDRRFYTGPYRLDPNSSERPGSKMIYLSSTTAPDSYFDLDRADLWVPTDDARQLEPLMSFIATLPFQQTGRMLVMYDTDGGVVPAHRDHIETEVLHEFIWFRTNLDKPLYLLNSQTGERLYVESYSAWFDTVNQFHGCDAGAAGQLTYSIRVDGRFTEEFRASIPRPAFNAASTPAYWAGFYEKGEG